jgi:mono/diheme cytochrome c family protein
MPDMRGATLLAIALLAAGASAASAQPYPAGATLSPTQKVGRALFAQHCMVCHVSTQLTSPGHYGPSLSGQMFGGNEDIIVAFVTNGTAKMPSFKSMFDQQQIRAIAAYVAALPAAPATASGAGKPDNPERSGND